MSFGVRQRREAQLPRRRQDNDAEEITEALAGQETPCPSCRATGQCPTCDGRGKVLPTEAQGAILRARRQAAGVKLRKLAEEMAVSPSYVGDLELGQRRLTAAMKRKYLEALTECGG